MESKDTNKGFSSNRFQPGEETFDDVEGHAFTSGRLTGEPATDDVDGHSLRGNAAPDEPTEDDTEGHSASGRF